MLALVCARVGVGVRVCCSEDVGVGAGNDVDVGIGISQMAPGAEGFTQPRVFTLYTLITRFLKI